MRTSSAFEVCRLSKTDVWLSEANQLLREKFGITAREFGISRELARQQASSGMPVSEFVKLHAKNWTESRD